MKEKLKKNKEHFEPGLLEKGGTLLKIKKLGREKAKRVSSEELKGKWDTQVPSSRSCMQVKCVQRTNQFLVQKSRFKPKLWASPFC